MSKRVLALLTVFVLLIPQLLGCAGAPQMPPATVSAPEAAVEAAPTEVAPTMAPTPVDTPTPLPPLPPRVVSWAPERGEELGVAQPVVLQFDQPMDRASVEQAWRIAPAIEGAIEWRDERTVAFVPAGAGFQRGSQYVVTLDASAQSAAGLRLQDDLRLSLRSAGYLEVAEVYPQPDTLDVDTNSPIRVAFNRPVVPLTSVGQMTGLPDPLAFSPPVEGQGSWVNTSIYSFQPSEGLAAGTLYTVRVSAGLQGVGDAVLAKDYAWSFTTKMPDLVSVYPGPDRRHIAPTGPVRLVFNQAMDTASVEERFSLVHSGTLRPVAGTFSWEAAAAQFAPAEPFERGAAYRIRLEKGSLSASGGAAMASTYAWQFTVAELPKVLAIKPRDGQTKVSTGAAIEVTFSSPISTTTFTKAFTITPPVGSWTYWGSDDTVAYVHPWLSPSTWYTVTLTRGILDRYGVPLEAETTVRFQTEPYEPMVSLIVPDRVGSYNAYSTPVANIEYRNVSRVDLSLYRVSSETFIALNGEDAWQEWDRFEPKSQDLVRRWSLPAEAALNVLGSVPVPLTPSEGASLPSGLYYLRVSAPEARYTQKHLLVVSPLNLTLKTSTSEALVWATDLSTGQPVSGVNLTIYDGQGQVLAQAATGRDGVARTTMPEQEPWTPLIAMARSQQGDGAVLRYWSRGISPWEFGLQGEPYPERYRAHLFTERGIYRPGQTVYFKGIIREDDDAQYRLPPKGTTVRATAEDSQGREFWQSSLRLSDLGTVDGAIELAEDASLGYYTLKLTVDERSLTTGFQVAEYRKPEFQVAVATDRDDYVQGESIQVSTEASYFFGGPVADARVYWRVMGASYFFDRWQGQGYYSFHDYDYEDFWPYIWSYGELISEGSGQTDVQGRLVFTLPADIREKVQSQQYTIEVSVTDLNNQEVSARTTCIVHKGTFYIGLGTDQYVGTAGKSMTVNVLTVDTQGADRPRQQVEVVFYKHEWYSVKEEADDGRFYWSNKVRDTALFTETVTTDERGRAKASFVPPEGGTYRVRGRGLDEYENEVLAALYLWVSGPGYINWGQRNDDRIELVADKKAYSPGETATVLVPSPYEGPVTALMTVERGHIFEHRLVTLRGNSERIELPILPEYAPNVYVSLVVVQGTESGADIASFRVGYVMLSVSTERKQLEVRITPDKERYQPRETATYQIETLDYRGRGVPAEVTLQLVDRAVESLVAASTRDIMQTFYAERGAGILTAATLAVSVDRHNLEYAREGKGGGGGDEGGLVRQEFPDTAFWAPAVRTDDSGKASVSVTLPDSLTTWRMTGQAVTAATEVGTARSDVVSTLDVMIRPMAPRFMVIGDRPVLGAVIHNNTARDLEMTATLDAQGLEVSKPQQAVTVPARGRAKIAWTSRVLPTEQASLKFSVVATRYADSVLLRLPVYHVSTPEVVGTSGQVDDARFEVIRLPEEIDSTLGALTMRLEPSLAAGMRDGLRFLRAYPYDCIEQTVSRFLPNVVTYRALQDLGIEDPELARELPQQVAVGLQRLYALQNLDGGWGWWQYDESDPIITAYVLFGLAEARRADLPVSADVLESAITYLYRWLAGRTLRTQQHLDMRATVLYALAEADRGDLGRSVSLYEDRAITSLYARALLAMTLEKLDPEETSRPQTLVNELVGDAILSATAAHWEEPVSTRWAMNTDRRTTAIVLKALVQLDPDNPLLPNVVRWLMNARRAGRWETTQENAWAIMALTDYMASTGELTADYAYALLLNGAELAAGQVKPETVDQVTEVQVPVAELKQAADNVVFMERTPSIEEGGTGKLYYSAFLQYYLPSEQIKPLDRGIVVNRQYRAYDDPEREIQGASVNDLVVVKLTLVAPSDLYFLVVEDPLPAGCEALDNSLATTRSERPPVLVRSKEGAEVARYWGWNWPSHTELRDEKVALFASYLRKGTYEYTYLVRCTTPGAFQVMPAVAYEMYAPDVFGRSAGGAFVVTEGE